MPVSGRQLIWTIQELEAYFVANIKSQIKRIRTNEAVGCATRASSPPSRRPCVASGEAADSGDREATLVALHSASRQLDKAASKGVIHANQAANKKSAMARRANDL